MTLYTVFSPHIMPPTMTLCIPHSNVLKLKNNDTLYNQEREIIALDRQGTQQQRPKSPMVTPPGMRVNTRYINSAKGTSQKMMPSVAYIYIYIYISSIPSTLGDTDV